MSAINGDKSRFHRERKQKIAKRKRTRELLAMVNAQPRSKREMRQKPPKSRCPNDSDCLAPACKRVQ